MFKRLFWLTTGIMIGWGSVLWVVHRVRQTARRFVPEQVSRDAADAARRLRVDVREAVTEGRAEMRSTEERLRSRLGGPGGAAR
ncbi:MAG TPA: hypothetical protein VK866_19265 [Acidimicrobiales bacterium]|nr:hypothetical protein [Acidimicrobiales bacterium]